MKKLKGMLLLMLIVISMMFVKNEAYAGDGDIIGDDAHSDTITSYFSIGDQSQGMLLYFTDYNGTMLDNSCIFIDQPSVLFGNQMLTSKYPTTSINFTDTVYPRLKGDDDITYVVMGLSEFNSEFNASMVFAHTGDSTNYEAIKATLTKNEVYESILDNNIFTNTKAKYDEWKNSGNESDSIYLIIEPVYSFRTPKTNYKSGQKATDENSTVWFGTVPGYSKDIFQEFLNPLSQNLATQKNSNGTGQNALGEKGYWWNALYSNQYFATFVCTNNPHSNLNLSTAGRDYMGVGLLPFSELKDATKGLGIGIFWVGYDGEDSPGEPVDPEKPPIDTPVKEVTHTYPGYANPDCFTYNHALPNYNLSNLLNPEGRMPSGKELTNGILVDKWFCSYDTKVTELSKEVSVTFTLNTVGEWTAWKEGVAVVEGKDFEKKNYNSSLPNFESEYMYHEILFSTTTENGKPVKKEMFYDHYKYRQRKSGYWGKWIQNEEIVPLLGFSEASYNNREFYSESEHLQHFPAAPQKDNAGNIVQMVHVIYRTRQWINSSPETYTVKYK